MGAQEPLTYSEIHSIQKRERSTRSLTKVSADFYERLAQYLADARAGLDEESAKGPSPRLVLLQGQLRNLQEMAKDIMVLRLQKVTELSFAAVEGGALADKPLTPQELAFAHEVHALVEATRGKLMPDSPASPTPKGAPQRAKAVTAATPPGAPPAPLASVPKAPPTASSPAEAAVLLRILEDVPPFEGEDSRVYKLKREDVVSLPRNFAQILLRRKKAVEMPVPP